jgi:hypothetical protein
MDRNLIEYYENAFSLFTQPGWKDFMEDVKRFLEPREDIMTVADAQQLNIRQGQIDALRWVLNRKEMMEAGYKQLMDSEEADSA